MKRSKIFIVVMVALLMVGGLIISCDLSDCPRSDRCKYDYHCNIGSCAARYYGNKCNC